MSNKLIQIHVDENIKERTDEVFAKQGLSTQLALKIMLTQVASTGASPFDDLFKAKV